MTTRTVTIGMNDGSFIGKEVFVRLLEQPVKVKCRIEDVTRSYVTLVPDGTDMQLKISIHTPVELIEEEHPFYGK